MQKLKLSIVCYSDIAWQTILVAGSIFGCLWCQTTGASTTTIPDLDRLEDRTLLDRRLSPQLIRFRSQLGVAELMYEIHKSCPHPQPLSQAWERGARAEGSGGVRANHTLNQQRPQSIAGVDNFNPDLKLPPPPQNIPIPPPQSPPEGKAQGSPLPSDPKPDLGSGAKLSTVGAPFAVLEGLQPNIQIDRNNSGQINQTIESTAILRLNNGDGLFFTTGTNTYEQPEVNTVTNIPLGINWETKINALKVRSGVGVDIFNDSTTPNFNLKVDYPLTTSLTVSADVQQGAYKFNAKTIGNRISALRYGPSIFWQIDKDTSFFSLLKLGNYSDSNQEQQSFSRIEHKLGEFSIAGNLFSWNYQNPTDKGYFAPSAFLVYTGEVAWEGSVIRDLLRCRLSVSLGGQYVNGQNSDAGGYQTKCTAKISPQIEADLGYSFSNVKNSDSGNSIANSQSIVSQIRWKF